MISFRHQFKVFVYDGKRPRHAMQHHSLNLDFCVFRFGAAIDHGVALMAAENAAEVRRLHADAGDVTFSDVAQHHRLLVITAVAVDPKLTVLAPRKLPECCHSTFFTVRFVTSSIA